MHQTDLTSLEAVAAELRLLREDLRSLEDALKPVGVRETCSRCGSEARFDVGDPTQVNVAQNYVKAWRKDHACGGAA